MTQRIRPFVWIAMLIIVFSFMSGGCGGGGGGSSDIDPSDTTVDFNALSGSWTARDGNATATGYGGTYQLRLRYGTALINVIQINNNEATIEEYVDFTWDSYQNSQHVDTILLYDNVSLLTRIVMP